LCDALQEQQYRATLSTYAPRLGRALCALGRYEEAEHWAQLGRELGDEHDLATQAIWRQVQALVHAHRGEQGEAEALARQAVAITERTDSLHIQGDALRDFAEVLHAGSRTEAAAAALEQALDRYQRKQSLVMVERVRARLAEIRPSLAPAGPE
jgi:tetratricopeptide (TPR) repeat protein